MVIHNKIGLAVLNGHKAIYVTRRVGVSLYPKLEMYYICLHLLPSSEYPSVTVVFRNKVLMDRNKAMLLQNSSKTGNIYIKPVRCMCGIIKI